MEAAEQRHNLMRLRACTPLAHSANSMTARTAAEGITIPHLLAGLVLDLRGAGQDLQGIVQQALRRRRGRPRCLHLQALPRRIHSRYTFELV